jgi:L-ascorbate metabolism protein UlaG (beta-lactamase superfamily)
VGPPWQQSENGYILKNSEISVYYEPHCMYNETELKDFQVDVIITPVVEQQLPYFTLVAGGEKAINLAKILKARYIIPMANGDLKQTGILKRLLNIVGSTEEFKTLAKEKLKSLKVLNVTPGDVLTV